MCYFLLFLLFYYLYCGKYHTTNGRAIQKLGNTNKEVLKVPWVPCFHGETVVEGMKRHFHASPTAGVAEHEHEHTELCGYSNSLTNSARRRRSASTPVASTLESCWPYGVIADAQEAAVCSCQSSHLKMFAGAVWWKRFPSLQGPGRPHGSHRCILKIPHKKFKLCRLFRTKVISDAIPSNLVCYKCKNLGSKQHPVSIDSSFSLAIVG